MASLKPWFHSVVFGTALAAGAVDAAYSAQIYDPWLERFQVGEFREPRKIALVEGWPADLLSPLTVDPGWRDGAARFFAGESLPRYVELVAWRLALPAYGDCAQADAVYRRARRQWRQLETLAEPGAFAADTLGATAGPWTSQVRQLLASRAWERGEYAAAAGLARSLVAEAASLALTPAQVFIWTLRAERLAGADRQAPPATAIWNTLQDLGPYDTRSGWAVWVALSRDRGLPALPDALAERQTGVMLATAGQLWLSAAEWHAAPFPPDVAAGLGALLLPVKDLAEHFRRWAQPPTDSRFQGYWLQGQRRLHAGAPAIEALATLPDLAPGHRLDLWRRASEARLLQDQWPDGLRALEAALGLLTSDASTALKDRLRIWVAQALSLALARQRTGDAQRIADLAGRYLAGEQAAAFRADAAPMLGKLGAVMAAAGADQRAQAEDLVLRGEAPPLELEHRILLPDQQTWRHRLWQEWARWGIALASPDPAVPAARLAYRRELESVIDTVDPDQRHTNAVAAAARYLRGTATVSAVVNWAIDRDIERLAAGTCLPASSPLPGLSAPASLTTVDRSLYLHALLGVGVALGDDRGTIAMAVRLPAAGVPAPTRWPFWYPLPADPAIRAALAAVDQPAELLLAIARNESLFEPAVRSRAGALGYMQIMPFHYQDPAGPPGPQHWRLPATSLRIGAKILDTAARRHGFDPYRSVAAYNAGSVAVERWDRQLSAAGDARALYRAWISYPETRDYTLRVLRDREIYRTLLAE
jgi:hypothetical protein